MQKTDTTSYASFIGVNKAVLPGIRILNDFLVNYFGYTLGRGGSKFKLSDLNDILDENKFEQISNIICKEQNENKRRILYKSFFEWVKAYIYYSYGPDNNNQRFLLPLTRNLLFKDDKAKDSSKNILFRVLYSEETNQEKLLADREAVLNFMFNTKNNDSIYGNIISAIDNIIIETIKKDIQKESANESIPVIPDEVVDINDVFKMNFKKDFACFLKSKCFFEMDIYRKINLFSLLLNFYQTLYLVNKAFEKKAPIILTKGTPNFSTDSGKFHLATLGSFSDIREKIFRMSENFFERRLENHMGSKAFFRLNEDKDLMIIEKDHERMFKDSRLAEFDSFGTKDTEKVSEFFIDYLQINVKGRNVERKEVARAIVELNKKMSSSVRVVSSMLSGQGKQARIVYPTNNAKQKYFAMSGEITELLLKLFLTQSGEEYDTLSTFLKWLENRYGIYIAFSDKLINYLNENSIQLPSTQEFTDNVQAFISTLESINAIYKLSDTSYIVSMPGKIGGILQI